MGSRGDGGHRGGGTPGHFTPQDPAAAGSLRPRPRDVPSGQRRGDRHSPGQGHVPGNGFDHGAPPRSTGGSPNGRPRGTRGSPMPGYNDRGPGSGGYPPAVLPAAAQHAMPSPPPGHGPLGAYVAPPGTYAGPPGTYAAPPGTYVGPPGTYAAPPGTYAAPVPMEAAKAVRPVEHKAAMEEGYAPASFHNQPQSQSMLGDEDMDPVLKELNTWPNVIASIVARSPGLCMLLLFLLLVLAAVPAFLSNYAPEPLTEFDSLQIKDHPAAANAFTVLTLNREDTFFLENVDGQGADGAARRKLAQLMTDGPGLGQHASATPHLHRTSTGSMRDLKEVEEVLDDLNTGAIGGVADTLLGVGAEEDCVRETRTLGDELVLAIFYRYSAEDGEAPRNAITLEMIEKAREVEEEILAIPEYQEVCKRACNGECERIISYSSFIYTSRESYLTGNLTMQDEPAWDPQEAGKFLVDNNFTFFFNIDSNGTYATWLRTIITFQEELGIPVGVRPYRDTISNRLIKLFDEESTGGIIINYGEDHINTKQINEQLFFDLRWAALSVALAAAMLRIGSGSTFMTLVGIFQIIISFPISWLVYSAPKDWQYVNFIHFLAPFVMLGIGLDDIFVSLAFFQNTRPFMGYFALDTRLTAAFSQASSAMLATSTTSAFAFGANIFSPVPAVQSFGLLLATLVIINYILAVTWLPVCLAAWDKHFEFPRRAAEARGDSTLCSCTLCGCLGCRGCCRGRRGMGSMGQTLRLVKGGQEPRALEFMQVVMPFWRTLKVTEQIKRHRLLHPDRPPVVISRSELERVQEENAYKIFNRSIDVRRMLGTLFDIVFRFRYIAIALCLVATLVGMAGTIALEPPPTSEPPIFDTDHNVQFFYRYITSNESDNLPSCPACLRNTMDTWTQLNDGAENPADFFDTTKPLIGFEEGGYSTVVASIVWGIAKGGIDNSPNAEDGDPAGIPVFNRLTFDDSFDISTLEGQQLVQTQLDDLMAYTTPAGVPGPEDPGGRSLFTTIEYNPLDQLSAYCNPVEPEDVEAFAEEGRDRYCDDLDGVNGLPTGNKFNALAYRLLATSADLTMRDFMGYRRQEDSGLSAFDFIICSNNFILGCNDQFPKIDWVIVAVRTTTSRNEPPESIVRTYEDWLLWSNTTQQEAAYQGQVVSSPDWVNAVTYKKISDSVYGTVFLSIGLAAAVVFVFCGPLMMLLAAVTVLMINVTVMGVLYLWDWDLGAVEAMSITSLVGLSVDFCIHMSEAFNHAQSSWAPDRATAAKSACMQYFSGQPPGREKSREALVLVAIPMVASAASTVITTTPLFAAATLILKRFAAVIFVTMLVGLVYVILFLTPMLAMFGPGVQKKKAIDEDTPLHVVVTDLLLQSKGVRFVGVAIISVLIMVAIPGTSKRMSAGGTLQELIVMLVAAAVVAMCVFIVSAFVRGAYHKKQHLEQHARHQQQHLAKLQKQMGQQSNVPGPSI